VTGPAEKQPIERVVLYVHGATFPSAVSIAHRFDGRSLRDYGMFARTEAAQYFADIALDRPNA
jgi:hypothetical protein